MRALPSRGFYRAVAVQPRKQGWSRQYSVNQRLCPFAAPAELFRAHGGAQPSRNSTGSGEAVEEIRRSPFRSVRRATRRVTAAAVRPAEGLLILLARNPQGMRPTLWAAESPCAVRTPLRPSPIQRNVHRISGEDLAPQLKV